MDRRYQQRLLLLGIEALLRAAFGVLLQAEGTITAPHQRLVVAPRVLPLLGVFRIPGGAGMALGVQHLEFVHALYAAALPDRASHKKISTS